MDRVFSLLKIDNFKSGKTYCLKCNQKLKLNKCEVAEYTGKGENGELVGFFTAEMPYCEYCKLYYIKSADLTAMQIDPAEDNHVLAYEYPHRVEVQIDNSLESDTAKSDTQPSQTKKHSPARGNKIVTVDLANVNTILKNRKNAEKLLNLSDISIEIDKKSILVTGDTYKHKETLKKIGFTWLKWKKCWMFDRDFMPIKNQSAAKKGMTGNRGARLWSGSFRGKR